MEEFERSISARLFAGLTSRHVIPPRIFIVERCSAAVDVDIIELAYHMPLAFLVCKRD